MVEDKPALTESSVSPKNEAKSPEVTSTSSPPEDAPKIEKLPSHSPLAFANYPPLWSKDKPRTMSSEPKPRRTDTQTSAGASLDTLKAVLSTTSNDERRQKKRFSEKDGSNNHQYLQQPDRSYTHPRLNIFGRDIGPLGKPPPLFRRKK